MNKTKTLQYKVIEKDGKYWGTTYYDGHGTCYGWTDIDTAKRSYRDSYGKDYCDKPTDMVSRTDIHEEDWSLTNLVIVEEVRTYKIIEAYSIKPEENQ